MKLNIFFLAIILIGIISCKSDDEIESDPETNTPVEVEPEPETNAPVEVCLDVNNPLFARITTEENDLIQLYTDKDTYGYPTMLKEMIIELNDGSISDIIFGDNGKPVLMIAPNGVKIFLEWISDTFAALTAIDPTTGDQINTYIDLLEEDVPETKVATNIVKPRSGNLEMKIESLIPKSASPSLITRAEMSSGTIPVRMNLKNCGSPTDGTCYIDVIGNDGEYLSRCQGIKISQGVYEAQIPKSFFSDYQNQYEAGEVCDKIIDCLSKVCEIDGYTNGGVKTILKIAGAKIATLPHIASKAIGIGIASIADKVVDFCCDKVAPRLGSMLCQKMIKDFAIYNSTHVTLLPRIYAIPHDIFGQAVEVNLGESIINDMEISWGGHPNISSFTLNPPAPMEGVPYVATAELYCIPNGSTIEMNVVGTDGYMDYISQTVTSESRTIIITLLVPGALTGVYDECTVIVTTPEGETYTKTASLIFQ
jgi:hypothetical protein